VIHPKAKVSIEKGALKKVRNHFEDTWENYFGSIKRFLTGLTLARNTTLEHGES